MTIPEEVKQRLVDVLAGNMAKNDELDKLLFTWLEFSLTHYDPHSKLFIWDSPNVPFPTHLESAYKLHIRYLSDASIYTPKSLVQRSVENFSATLKDWLSRNQATIDEEREKLREYEELQERLMQVARAKDVTASLKELRKVEKGETGMTATEAYLAYKAKVEQGG